MTIWSLVRMVSTAELQRTNNNNNNNNNNDFFSAISVGS